MFNPIPGGTSQRIGFEDDEYIDVQLPPVGYVVDKLPDPKTGKPSEKLIRSEILFDDLPLADKKWRKPLPPEGFDRWLEEEEVQQQLDPKYRNPDAEYYRAQEWRRRVNGVWIAIGNKKNEPVEYVYLTGFAYFYLTHWYNGYDTKFRFVLLKIFYALAWAEENPLSYGVILSTLRRLGKTAIAFCYLYDYCSRRKYAFGGMQAQKEDVAKEFFDNFLIKPFLQLPQFFIPNHANKYADGLFFSDNKKSKEKSYLMGSATYRETKSNAYDKNKLHRYIVEEPGKWGTVDVYTTFEKVKPALKDGPKIIGKCFLPTTVEELDLGGASFIRLAEDSRPSHMRKNEGRTRSGLIFIFIPAHEGYVFEEYGRSVVDDPLPNEEVIGEDGKRIYKGSKTLILEDRNLHAGDVEKLSTSMRQYPMTWEEAKSMSNQFCHFNHQLLTHRLQYLNTLKTTKYTVGNFDWVDKKDGDVDFFRDDHNGRCKVTMLLDEHEEGDTKKEFKVANNVRKEWDSDSERYIYSPLNDHKFAIGVDPIKNEVTDDPNASKAAAYVLWKYDPLIDAGKPEQKPGLPVHLQFKTNKFILEYLCRPEDPEIFHEDIIKICRYFGCSVFDEGNVETFRQHFKSRGYAAFLVNRGHFSDEALPGINKEGINADKSVRTDPTVTHNLINRLHMYYNRYIDLVDFDRLLEDSLAFRLKKHFKKDAVFGAGYTLINSDRRIAPPEPDDKRPIELELFPMYDQSGTVSREIDITELTETW